MIYIVKGNKLYSSETSSQYTGDKIGGELNAWDTILNDPNQFIKESYGILSKRNATLYQTEPVARACINKPLSYAIGDGVVFKSAINADFLRWRRKRANEWSKRFTTLLHLEKLAAGWYDNQSILFREASMCGDSILYFVRDEGQELPVELIPSSGNSIDWEYTREAERWMLGVKLDKYNRRVAFRQTDETTMSFKDKNGNINAIQFMFQELAGQARGYGVIHSAIALIKKMGKVWDATIARMVLESIMLGYFNADKTDVGRQMRQYADRAVGNSATMGSAVTTPTALQKSNNMEPGTMLHMQNKESMTFTDLKTPSDNFGLANEWFINMVAMARGYSPEFIMGKYSTSYTAHKGAFNDSIKKFMQERGTFTNVVEKAVNLEYLKHFVRTGQLDAPASFWTDHKTREALLMGTYLGPVPGHINPLQEVKADQIAVQESFNDFESVSRKYGHDWYDKIDEWSEQQAMWAAGSPQYKAETMAIEESKRQDAEEAKSSDEGAKKDEDN